MRNIVDSMFEQTTVSGYNLFKNFKDINENSEQFVTKYSMFLASLLEPRYQWFLADLKSTMQLKTMLIDEDDLETLIGYFRTACVKNDIAKPVIVAFLDFIVSSKKSFSVNNNSYFNIMSNNKSGNLMDSVEQSKKFEMFIERFFLAV